MGILTISSVIASFFAGIAALFAPCCITVLLPSYIGSIFSQRRMVLGMTGVFSLGLLAVFLPIGLGAGFLGQLFSIYHDQIYILGALFLLFLGTMVFLGSGFSLPWHTSVRAGGTFTFFSIFTLGVFSGFATSCCAPVLAGIVTLSVLPGSMLLGGLYAVSYVLGMVAPLFFLAWVLERTRFTQQFWIMRKAVSYTLFGKKISITAANLLTAIIFVGMGILILWLAFTGNLQVSMGYREPVDAVRAWILERLAR